MTKASFKEKCCDLALAQQWLTPKLMIGILNCLVPNLWSRRLFCLQNVSHPFLWLSRKTGEMVHLQINLCRYQGRIYSRNLRFRGNCHSNLTQQRLIHHPRCFWGNGTGNSILSFLNHIWEQNTNVSSVWMAAFLKTPGLRFYMLAKHRYGRVTKSGKVVEPFFRRSVGVVSALRYRSHHPDVYTLNLTVGLFEKKDGGNKKKVVSGFFSKSKTLLIDSDNLDPPPLMRPVFSRPRYR